MYGRESSVQNFEFNKALFAPKKVEEKKEEIIYFGPGVLPPTFKQENFPIIN